jgi:hypothetical protein
MNLKQLRQRTDYANLVIWQSKFEKANRIKRLMYNYQYTYLNLGIDLDARMKKIWLAVEKVEPVKTFENGCLTGNASGLLTLIKLSKIFK